MEKINWFSEIYCIDFFLSWKQSPAGTTKASKTLHFPSEMSVAETAHLELHRAVIMWGKTKQYESWWIFGESHIVYLKDKIIIPRGLRQGSDLGRLLLSPWGGYRTVFSSLEQYSILNLCIALYCLTKGGETWGG